MRRVKRLLAVPLVAMSSAATVFPGSTTAQEATPAMTYACEERGGTPSAMMPQISMAATPEASGEQMAMELDQMYIDMMIPHHQGIIGLAQAALPRLEDARLRKIALSIIDAQSAEIEELRGYREAFYGGADPMPMDEGMMAAMEQMMPGISGTRKEMTSQMDPAAQAAAICAAENTDLAFTEMTIAHHQMAIEASEPVVADATHEEIREFAQRVIEDQQREIEELKMIQAELSGQATPAS